VYLLCFICNATEIGKQVLVLKGLIKMSKLFKVDGWSTSPLRCLKETVSQTTKVAAFTADVVCNEDNTSSAVVVDGCQKPSKTSASFVMARSLR
jgi:hypothetical protein